MIFYNIIRQLESPQNIGYKPVQGEKWKKFSTLEKSISTMGGKTFHIQNRFTVRHTDGESSIRQRRVFDKGTPVRSVPPYPGGIGFAFHRAGPGGIGFAPEK
ncbi:MAG TPA: hypothetical protein ENN18_05220 [Proteobacteria bacterium]|nr:hypothetical protein [Pseudomonadota bacterium]